MATDDELQAAFPLRFPVAARPKVRKVHNLITGKMQTVKEWGSAKPFPELPRGTTYPNKAELKAVTRLPQVRLKWVEQVRLVSLQVIVSGGDAEQLCDEMCRPALVAPGDDNSTLFRLPASWIKAVAGIEKVPPVAKAWAASEECQFDNWTVKDATKIIVSLRKLALQSLAESKGMFLWINL